MPTGNTHSTRCVQCSLQERCCLLSKSSSTVSTKMEENNEWEQRRVPALPSARPPGLPSPSSRQERQAGEQCGSLTFFSSATPFRPRIASQSLRGHCQSLQLVKGRLTMLCIFVTTAATAVSHWSRGSEIRGWRWLPLPPAAGRLDAAVDGY